MMTTHDTHDHDIIRFDDDGAPPPRERIGIAPPEKIVRLGGGDGPMPPSKIILVGGASEPPSEPPQILGPMGEPVSSLTWNEYLEWRRTKCRPYDIECCPRFASKTDMPPDLEFEFRVGGEWQKCTRARALEEIDQATLEFIGEVAELGELVNKVGPRVFFDKAGSAMRAGDVRSPHEKLIDEAGDIFFCGAWVLDSWGKNPLREITEDLELIRVSDDDPLAQMARVFVEFGVDALRHGEFAGALGSFVLNNLLVAQANSGLLANSFKKLRYHRRQQQVDTQVERVILVLIKVNELLILANSSVEEALKTNMRKLDARFPKGYQPGQGGGNRTGEGA